MHKSNCMNESNDKQCDYESIVPMRDFDLYAADKVYITGDIWQPRTGARCVCTGTLCLRLSLCA